MQSPHRPGARRWLCVLPATLALLALAVGPASAAVNDRWGTVAVIDASTDSQNIVDGEPQVCDFYFEFDLNETSNVVAWEVKTWNATPSAGTTVLSDKGGPTDADGKLRQPDSGSLSLQDGRYNVIWDDEDPIDDSNGHQSFTVACESATPTPTPTVAPATPTPTPTPTGVVLPATGTPKPTPAGAVEAATGTAQPTLPPTDASVSRSAGSATGIWLVAAGVGLLSFVLLTLLPSRLTRRLPVRQRRGRS
jgi:hypothetical protein